VLYNCVLQPDKMIAVWMQEFMAVSISDVNIEFFQNPDIESENPVKIRISDFI